MHIIASTDRLGMHLARLNATHGKFDIGVGGGLPGLTPQDIAAAVGMVPAGLGRELLLYVYWPDGAERSKEVLLQLLSGVQLAEHNDREMAVHGALFQVAITSGTARVRANEAYSRAKAATWPQIVLKLDPVKIAKPYEGMRLAVLDELSNPRVCPECQGREGRDRMGVAKVCDRCMGRGVVEYGATWRAKRLKMTRSAFLQRWEGPYIWLLDVARSLLAEAEEEMLRKLR